MEINLFSCRGVTEAAGGVEEDQEGDHARGTTQNLVVQLFSRSCCSVSIFSSTRCQPRLSVSACSHSS